MPDHNAHLVMVQGSTVPPDPVLGIGGSGPATKWSGDCQAHLQAGTQESVVGSAGGQERVLVPVIQARIPSNIPVTIAVNDVLTFHDNGSTATYKMTVRDLDTWARPMGIDRFILRQS